MDLTLQERNHLKPDVEEERVVHEHDGDGAVREDVDEVADERPEAVIFDDVTRTVEYLVSVLSQTYSDADRVKVQGHICM